MNKDIKVKDNKQKSKDACPAETEADSEQKAKNIFVAPPHRQTAVLCVRATGVY